MKTSLQILLGLILLIVLFTVLSTVLGYLIWAVIITALVGLVAALVRVWWGDRQARKGPNLKVERRADKAAEKKLKELERQVEAERNRL
jgi:O-antigen/teichoic acid export membrane protein